MASILKVDKIVDSGSNVLATSSGSGYAVDSGVNLASATLPAGSVIQLAFDSFVPNSSASFVNNSSYQDTGLEIAITNKTAGNYFLIRIDYRPKVIAPTSPGDPLHYTRLYGGLTSSQSQLWELKWQSDNLGKLGDSVYWATTNSFSYKFTTSSVASHTFKVQWKTGTDSNQKTAFDYGGGELTIMEIAG